MSNTGSGGSYTINEQGERVLTEAPTQDHPQGNRPREACPELAEAAATPFVAPEYRPAKKPAAVIPTE